MSFRPNPFHANYILNVYNMSYVYLNKTLFKPIKDLSTILLQLKILFTAMSLLHFISSILCLSGHYGYF